MSVDRVSTLASLWGDDRSLVVDFLKPSRGVEISTSLRTGYDLALGNLLRGMTCTRSSSSLVAVFGRMIESGSSPTSSASCGSY